MNTRDAILLCVDSPGELYQLDPGVFESVVAELLAGFGWEVSLTPPTSDGGYDILGITTDPSGLRTSWIVECKRYSRNHKVGVEMARSILGVKRHIGVPNAVLVTTSDFTRGARDLSSAHQDLQLVDFETLRSWLGDYAPLPLADSYTADHTFSSCFISHSSKDKSFAEKLTAGLRREGVPVWYAPEDILPGERIFPQVKAAIRSFDRLLVVLSENSMASDWVQIELVSALARERSEGRRVLFPVAIADFETVRQWQCIDADTGVDIARELRSYHIPDFSDWTNPASFEKQLAKVVQALGGSQAGISRADTIFRLQQRLRGGSVRDREAAARELGELGRTAGRAVATLRKALKDPSLYVRSAAAWALGEIGSEEARSALRDFEEH